MDSVTFIISFHLLFNLNRVILWFITIQLHDSNGNDWIRIDSVWTMILMINDSLENQISFPSSISPTLSLSISFYNNKF